MVSYDFDLFQGDMVSKKPISLAMKQIPPPEKPRKIRAFVKLNGFFAHNGQKVQTYTTRRFCPIWAKFPWAVSSLSA